nr:response regulator [Gemmatimonadota bacterium]
MERRFAAAVRVTEVDYGAVDEIQGGGWSLLVLDEPLGTEEAEARLRQIRSAHSVAELPVIACLDSSMDRERARVLIAEFGVEQILFYPLNHEELAQQIARILNTSLPPAPVESAPRHHVRAAMAEMWTRLQDSVFRRLELLEEAVASALEDHLGADQRREAEREAHKLAGSIGTFGFMEASRRAREMEHIFEGAAPLAPSEAARLADLVVEIRNELERAPTNPEPEEDQAVPEAGPGSVLLVSGDTGLAEQITRAATARGIQVETVPDLTGVEALLARESFRVVLLDLDTPPDSTQAFDLIGGLATRSPAIPVLVLASSGAFTDRIQAMRRGAAVFLQKPLQSDGILDAVTRHMGDPQTKGLRLLALDDDPHMLAVLRGMLAPTGIQLTTESDPLRFWEVLEETTPDLLILDLDLPHVSGIEICRVVRSDQRWSGLPILFLTARTDTDAVRRIFAAGADDYVAKPVAGPELLSRIRNRWERIQLYRRLAETDFLTGVVTRGKSVEMMERLLSLARRNAQPFSVAVLDLD